MAALKLLWIPQLSVTHKTTDGKLLWNLTSDSNWRHASELIKGFKEVNKDIEVTIVVPNEENLVDVSHLQEVPADYFTYLDFYTNAYATRFDFKVKDWVNILSKTDYDVIWVNDPCLVMSIKSVYAVLNKEVPLIVSYNHWPDSPLSPKTPEFMSYYIRQIEGALYSDLHFVYTEFSKKFLIKGAKIFFNENVIRILNKKTYAAYCPITDLMPKAPQVLVKANIPTIAYTQRLSDLPYYRKSLDNAIRIMNKLEKQGLKFKFRIFNHANKPLPKEFGVLNYLEVVYPKDKVEYYNLLKECHASLDCYEDERVWSITNNEACSLYVFPVLKYIDGYKEMYSRSYKGYYRDENNAVQILSKVIKYKNYTQSKIWTARDYMLTHFSPQVIAKTALDRINAAIIEKKNSVKQPVIKKSNVNVLR